MKIEIGYNRKIGDVQKEFNDLFPFLRIEFLQKGFSDNKNNDSGTAKFIKPFFSFGELNRQLTPGSIEFTGSITVYELEDALYNKTGLPARILRKSDNIWIETTMTGNWSLVRQNEHGREISVVKVL